MLDNVSIRDGHGTSVYAVFGIVGLCKSPGLGCQYTYKYDPSGRIAQIDSQDHVDLAFEYDDLYQLTALDSSDDTQDESFQYDLLGNRNARYSAGFLLMESADARFLYDPNGNVIQQWNFSTQHEASVTGLYNDDFTTTLEQPLGED